MHLQHLRAFVTIVDTGTFANTSARLHLSQPALSRQIDALERDLGVSLFERVGRRVRLTSDGEQLLANCRRLLADVAALGEQARALNSGEAGLLRVGAPPGSIESLLAHFLASFGKLYPRVDVHLIEAGGVRLRDLLSRGEVQIAVMPIVDFHFRFQKLYPTCNVAVMPEGHRLCRRAPIEVGEFADETMLLLTREFATRGWFDAACKLTGIHPRVRLESSAPHTIIAMAKAGHEIAVVPSTVPVAGDGMRAIPIVHRDEPIGGWLVAAWDGRRFFAPYAVAFVKALSASVRKEYPGRDHLRRLKSLPPIPSREE
jgi:LysR family cyn operon transcriptional activator